MLLVTIPCCHLQIVCHIFWFFQNSTSLWLLKMYFVFGVKGALFVSLVSSPHVLSPVQSLYPGLDICSVSCLIVAVVLTEEQTKMALMFWWIPVLLHFASIPSGPINSKAGYCERQGKSLGCHSVTKSHRTEISSLFSPTCKLYQDNELYLLSMRKILLIKAN